jgi:hypothetical protein
MILDVKNTWIIDKDNFVKERMEITLISPIRHNIQVKFLMRVLDFPTDLCN